MYDLDMLVGGVFIFFNIRHINNDFLGSVQQTHKFSSDYALDSNLELVNRASLSLSL